MQIALYNFYMEKEVFINKIKDYRKNFDFNKIKLKGSYTQKRAELTEAYVGDFINDILGGDVKNFMVVPAGSQLPYDYIVIKKSNVDSWPEPFKSNFLEKYETDGKIHKLIKENFDGIPDEVKSQILRIEVKAGKGNYVGNDTLPDPSNPVIYFFFDWKKDELLVVSSVRMAKKTGPAGYNYIVSKYTEDRQQVDQWRKDKIEQWKGYGISSAPRMNYRFKSAYAYTDQNDEEFGYIYEIFKKALWNE